MRLKTKLVLGGTTAIFAVVLALSALFVAELWRQRLTQTATGNEMLARQVLLLTRGAVESGLREAPPGALAADKLLGTVTALLRDDDALQTTMLGSVRYSPSVQDVNVCDASGRVLTSTDPSLVDQPLPYRADFAGLRTQGVVRQATRIFGAARVLDVAVPLERNGAPFLVVHVGVRSTFLKENYAPALRDALGFLLAFVLLSVVSAGVVASVALRPIEEISRRLDELTGGAAGGVPPAEGALDAPRRTSVPSSLLVPGGTRFDAFGHVTETIDRLGQQMRSAEAGYLDLETNLRQILDTLRDGVILFTGEGRAAMVSDAIANFIPGESRSHLGRRLDEIFPQGTALGRSARRLLERTDNAVAERVRLEDGREVEVHVTAIAEGGARGPMLGTLMTLRDSGSARRLEQELDLSRRLAAVGRLTAGVGHEVKNPINSMVLHLELLKDKLEIAGRGRAFLTGAQAHVDILRDEMRRLDRVVQTLADFNRPLEPSLRELDLEDVARTVLELMRDQMADEGIALIYSGQPAFVLGDGELLHQALLNLILNGMQAMPHGGLLRLRVEESGEETIVEITDAGEGIRPELLPRIFDLYFTTKAAGSGIGLATTYRIIQMHGGAIEVASTLGEGSSFTVRLPASRVRSAGLARPDPVAVGAGGVGA